MQIFQSIQLTQLNWTESDEQPATCRLLYIITGFLYIWNLLTYRKLQKMDLCDLQDYLNFRSQPPTMWASKSVILPTIWTSKSSKNKSGVQAEQPVATTTSCTDYDYHSCKTSLKCRSKTWCVLIQSKTHLRHFEHKVIFFFFFIFMLSDKQCMTSYVSNTICCNMKIIGITEEPDVLLSDNQRLREQT
jgi:hypothetical protein